jgi:hypothetical protein
LAAQTAAMADGPDHDAGQPEAQAQAERAGQRAVHDGEARGAPPSRIGSQSARWTGTVKPGTSSAAPSHQTSAPPPNEKNDRKKLDAAKAIDRPNTIWIRRRKPPDVAEGQRQAGDDDDDDGDDLGDRALDRLRMDCSGASHGIDEPEAWAAPHHDEEGRDGQRRHEARTDLGQALDHRFLLRGGQG